MKMNSNKGFTLIELLVVVAIIGILSSVVLASLNTARSKGKDAAVKSQLSSMRGQAEIFNNSQASPTYAGVCAATQANNGLLGLLNATVSANAVTVTLNPVAATNLNAVGTGILVTCHDIAGSWAAEAPLSGSTAVTPNMYCVDSTGASKAEATAVLGSGATSCN